MRNFITASVSTIEAPDLKTREQAANLAASEINHNHLLLQWPCLQTIESMPAPLSLPKPRELSIAAWNLERCKHVEASADLIRQHGFDVVLATEMDIGMARSQQRHTPQDLASELGFGYVYGTEFVELGTGDNYETQLFSGIPNDMGLHGNAILSRYPLENPRIIPLDDTGLWYTSNPKDDNQRRVGGRMAIAAQIQMATQYITVTAVHYESESDSTGRMLQTKTLLDALDQIYGNSPQIIGGDLNTAALAGVSSSSCLHHPESVETCFDTFKKNGWNWKTENDGLPTTRAAPGKAVKYPLTRLDWLLTYQLLSQDARTIAAISNKGEYLSDHECIAMRVSS